MKTFDDATEQWMARLLDEAPPLPDDLAALVVRTFARNAQAADATPDAA